MFHRKFLPGEAESKPAHWAKPCPAVSWGNLALAGLVCVGFLHSLVCHLVWPNNYIYVPTYIV